MAQKENGAGYITGANLKDLHIPTNVAVKIHRVLGDCLSLTSQIDKLTLLSSFQSRADKIIEHQSRGQVNYAPRNSELHGNLYEEYYVPWNLDAAFLFETNHDDLNRRHGYEPIKKRNQTYLKMEDIVLQHNCADYNNRCCVGSCCYFNLRCHHYALPNCIFLCNGQRATGSQIADGQHFCYSWKANVKHNSLLHQAWDLMSIIRQSKTEIENDNLHFLCLYQNCGRPKLNNLGILDPGFEIPLPEFSNSSYNPFEIETFNHAEVEVALV